MVRDGACAPPHHEGLNLEQLRIARLDLLGLRLYPGGVLLHQLDVGELAPSRLRGDLQMHRMLRGEIHEELLGLAAVQPGLEQLCRVRMRGGGEDAGRTTRWSACPRRDRSARPAGPPP